MDFKNIKVDMVVLIRLKSGAWVSGVVAVKSNIEFKDMNTVVFRVQITEGQFIDISEDDIKEIYTIDGLQETKEYLT